MKINYSKTYFIKNLSIFDLFESRFFIRRTYKCSDVPIDVKHAYISQNFRIKRELRRKYFIKNRDVHCKALNLRILQYYKMY